MISQAFDDFIDDCFISRDDICKFEIYKSRKYEKRVNPFASKLIAFSKRTIYSVIYVYMPKIKKWNQT